MIFFTKRTEIDCENRMKGMYNVKRGYYVKKKCTQSLKYFNVKCLFRGNLI